MRFAKFNYVIFYKNKTELLLVHQSLKFQVVGITKVLRLIRLFRLYSPLVIFGLHTRQHAELSVACDSANLFNNLFTSSRFIIGLICLAFAKVCSTNHCLPGHSYFLDHINLCHYTNMDLMIYTYILKKMINLTKIVSAYKQQLMK